MCGLLECVTLCGVIGVCDACGCVRDAVWCVCVQVPAGPRSAEPDLEPEDARGAAGLSGGRDALLRCGPRAGQR